MGWGNCGTDSKGRPIGYIFPATCDHPDCLKEIHRGLDYVCGGMHGEDEYSCEKYFCWDHRDYLDVETEFEIHGPVCIDCQEHLKKFKD